jgi:tetratricopeptide (TPR) repeat protein
VIRLLLPFILLAGLAGCRTEWPGSQAPELIQNEGEFGRVWRELQEMTERPLSRFEYGEPLSGDDLTLISWAFPKAKGLVAFKPNDFASRVILAKLHRAASQRQEAMSAYKEALAVVPSRPTRAEVAVLASLHSDMAGIFFTQREFNPAEDSLREALRLAPSSVPYRIQLVQVLLEARQTGEARRVLAEAEKLNPKSNGVRAMKALLGAQPASREASASSSPRGEETLSGSAGS